MPIYMQYESIKGPATGKHAGWIPLDAVSAEINRTVGDEERKPTSNGLVVVKQPDSSSVALQSEVFSGTTRSVKIDFVAEGNIVYLTIDLENVIISSYQFQGKNRPTEMLTLNYAKATYRYSAAANATNSPNRATLDLVADPNP